MKKVNIKVFLLLQMVSSENGHNGMLVNKTPEDDEFILNTYAMKGPGKRFYCRVSTNEDASKTCEYSAADRSILRGHIRAHLKIKPYQCMFCGYSASWGSPIHAHIRKYHPDNALKLKPRNRSQ